MPRDQYCHVCNREDLGDPNHNNSQTHRYNFLIWEYKQYKRAIAKDRHGVELTVEPKYINNLCLDYRTDTKRGNHTISILTEQLVLHNNTVIFSCTIKNDRLQDKIHLTSAHLLHPDEVFSLIDPRQNLNTDAILTFEPKATYEFQIYFTLTQLTTGSFKIPLACSFQDDKENTFTIARSLIVEIDNEKEINERVHKSPFTKKTWPKDLTIVEPRKLIRGPDNWLIPKNFVRPLKYGLKRSDHLTDAELKEVDDIRSKLGGNRVTLTNYKDFWHTLLWMEEATQTLMLQSYNMENVTMEVKTGDILVLEVPGLAEKRPSVVHGDFIELRVHEDHHVYKGVVKGVADRTIDIHYVDESIIDIISNNPGLEMDVRFIMGRISYERMHEGVENVVRSGMVSHLFPSNVENIQPATKQLDESDFINKDVVRNDEQKKAVEKILFRTHHSPYIVFGPPGTGKTVTIVEAILQIRKRTNKRILVCAPANAACDMITSKLAPYCSTSELMRIHSSTREMKTISAMVRQFSNIDEEGDVYKLMISKISTYRIIVTTLIYAAGINRAYRPDYLFIDEASQTTEPETDAAIGLLTPDKHLILAGDPKQLGPMVMSKVCAEYKLERSLLDRLMDYEIYYNFHPDFITMLRLNFRSHPDILEIPNELFYENRLIAVSETALRDPIANLAIYPRINAQNWKKNQMKIPKGCAIEFCSVISKEKKEGSSPSYFNPDEVRMVINYVRALTTLNLPIDAKVNLDEIGVVTPYKRQVFKIQMGLAKNGFGDVEVGSTECFQGREKRIMIISTVRAQHNLLQYDRKFNLGFVRNEKRFNVAVTRAISKLIVIGCPTVLGTDRLQWLRLIEKCERSCSFFGTPYIRRDQQFKQNVMTRVNRVHMQDTQYRD